MSNLRKFTADLHIHSCLSPCADLLMGPENIIKKALEKKLNMIAITDHNSADNCKAFIDFAKNYDICIIPGMEVTTKEEVHIIALFPSLDDAILFQGIVYQHLKGKNDPSTFGFQPIINEKEEVLGFNDHLLIGATDLTLDDTVRRIHSIGGIAISAHIDKEIFSVVAQLGFIPDGIGFDALEISSNFNKNPFDVFPEYSHYTFIKSSDAHFPEDIGKSFTTFYLNLPNFV